MTRKRDVFTDLFYVFMNEHFVAPFAFSLGWWRSPYSRFIVKISMLLCYFSYS